MLIFYAGVKLRPQAGYPSERRTSGIHGDPDDGRGTGQGQTDGDDVDSNGADGAARG